MDKLAPFLALIAVIAVIASPLRADNCVQNGDFSAGADHWRGDGQSPADLAAAASDPFAKPDPMLSKGLIIPLKEHSWTKSPRTSAPSRRTSSSRSITCSPPARNFPAVPMTM